MCIVYNLLFTITINIENSYNRTNTARWPYRIIRLHKYTQVQYLSFGKSLVYTYIYIYIFFFIFYLGDFHPIQELR